MRTIVIIIVLLLWALWGYNSCNAYKKCCETPAVVPVVPTIDCPDVPIGFVRNECNPRFGSGFTAFRDSILGLLKDGQKVQIIGLYKPDEAFTGTAENLGVCRANAIRQNLISIFDSTRIEVTGQIAVGAGTLLGDCLTDAYRFNIVDKEVAISNNTLIYFPFNSTQKLDDAEVEKYLQDVATNVKSSGQVVHLTGHTDNVGNDNGNMKLGLRRAQVIADYLKGLGVPAAQITVDSKGESMPVATNDTEEGRALNRRTELQITQQ